MHIEWMLRQKDRVVNREQEAKYYADERENMIKDLPHPYTKELDTCDHLVGYLTELKRKAGLIVESEDLARETQKEFMAEAVKQNLQKRMEEGKIQECVNKKDREAMENVQLGKRKKNTKNDRKEKKNNENTMAFEFNIDITVIKKFAILQVSPPISVDGLDAKLEEI